MLFVCLSANGGGHADHDTSVGRRVAGQFFSRWSIDSSSLAFAKAMALPANVTAGEMIRDKWLDFEIMVRSRKAPDGQVDNSDAVRTQLTASWDDPNRFRQQFKDEVFDAVSRFTIDQDRIDNAHLAAEAKLAEDPQLVADTNGGSSFPKTARWKAERVSEKRIKALGHEREAIDQMLRPKDANDNDTAEAPPVDALLTVMGYTVGVAGSDALETSRVWLQAELVRYRQRKVDINAELRRQQIALLKLQQRNRVLGVDWVGGWVLGSGSYGMAQAWVKRNDQDCIIDVSLSVLCKVESANSCCHRVACRHQGFEKYQQARLVGWRPGISMGYRPTGP